MPRSLERKGGTNAKVTTIVPKDDVQNDRFQVVDDLGLRHVSMTMPSMTLYTSLNI